MGQDRFYNDTKILLYAIRQIKNISGILCLKLVQYSLTNCTLNKKKKSDHMIS